MNIQDRLQQEFPGQDIQLLEEVNPIGNHKTHKLVVNGKSMTLGTQDDDGLQLLHEVMTEDALYNAARDATRLLITE